MSKNRRCIFTKDTAVLNDFLTSMEFEIVMGKSSRVCSPIIYVSLVSGQHLSTDTERAY